MRFYSLDGLRGLAAICVMIYHYTSHSGLHLLGGAYVAVDLFFILSGFVLMHSYGKQIADGMTFKHFVLIRVIRLYPMFLIGMLMGVAGALIFSVAHGSLAADLHKITTAFALNLFFIPYINQESWVFDKDILVGIIFPLNDPGWSLFFELFVNFFFFAFIQKYKNIKLLSFVVVAYLVFICSILIFKSPNPGWGERNFVAGFPRVVAEFFMGLLIYQYYLKIQFDTRKLSLVVTALVFLLMIIGSVKLSLINSIILSPLLVLCLATYQLSPLGNKIGTFLGDLSYPLYITHVPVYHLLINIPAVQALPVVLKVCFIATVATVLTIVLIRVDKVVRKKMIIKLGLQAAK